MAAKQRMRWLLWEPDVECQNDICRPLHALSKKEKGFCALCTRYRPPSLQLPRSRLGVSKTQMTTALRLQQSVVSCSESYRALKGSLSAEGFCRSLRPQSALQGLRSQPLNTSFISSCTICHLCAFIGLELHVGVIAGLIMRVSSAPTVVFSARWQRYQSLFMHCSVAQCSTVVDRHLKGLTAVHAAHDVKVACLELRENLLGSIQKAEVMRF